MHVLFVYGALIYLTASVRAFEAVRSEDGTEYFIATKSENWYGAVQACALLNKSLVAIESSAKQTQIANVLKRYHAQNGFVGYRTWIAGNDNAAKGRYTWITNGREFSFTQWAPNEPNHAENEHCVEMRPGDYRWNDVPCSTKFPFICEENQFVKDKNREVAALKASHEKDKNLLTQIKNQELEQSKKAHDKAMQQLLVTQNQKLVEQKEVCDKSIKKSLEDHKQEIDNMKKMEQESSKQKLDLQQKLHTEEMGKVLKQHTLQLAALNSSHAKDIAEYNQRIDILKESHKNKTLLMVQQKVNELNQLQNTCAKQQLQMTQASDQVLENLKKSFELKMKLLKDEQRVDKEEMRKSYETARVKDIEAINQTHVNELKLLEDRKNQELQQLKDKNEKQKLLDITTLEKSHEEDATRLREQMQQELEVAKQSCEEQMKQMLEEKKSVLQRINDTQMNHTNSYKLYNIIFHGNNNKG